MKVGVVADTHDRVENIKEAVELFQGQGIKTVLHLGDYVAPFSVRLFKGLKLIGVLGNNDGDKYRLEQAFADIGGELQEDLAVVELAGVKFALYHGTELAIREALIGSGRYAVVLFGHNHQKEVRQEGRVLVVNPGTAHGYGAEKPTVAIFETKSRAVEFAEL